MWPLKYFLKIQIGIFGKTKRNLVTGLFHLQTTLHQITLQMRSNKSFVFFFWMNVFWTTITGRINNNEKGLDISGYKERDFVACSKSSLKVSKFSMSWICLHLLSPAHVDVLLHLVKLRWTTIMFLKRSMKQTNKLEVFHLTVISKHPKVNAVLAIEAHYRRFVHLTKKCYFWSQNVTNENHHDWEHVW